MPGSSSSPYSSSAVMLSDVDDYLGPSQACINPLFGASNTDSNSRSTAISSKITVIATSYSSMDLELKSDQEQELVGVGAVVTTRPRSRRRRIGVGTASTADEIVPPSASQHPTSLQTSDPITNGSSSSATTTRNNYNNTTLSPSSSATKQLDNKRNVDTNKTNDDENNNINRVVQASLADCLACSGCVTTAETVLLEEQHSLEVLRQMLGWKETAGGSISTTSFSDETMQASNHQEDRDTTVPPMIVMTISPASYADWNRQLGILHSQHGITLELLQQQWTTLLYDTLQVQIVLDGNIPLEWSLQASSDEFCKAYRSHSQLQGDQHHSGSATKPHMDHISSNREPNGTSGLIGSSTTIPLEEQWENEQIPSKAVSSTETMYRLVDGNITTISRAYHEQIIQCGRQQQQFPLLASSCPAVVCLIEKSLHGALKHLATTKSPMAMAGAFWKQLVHHHEQQQQQQYAHQSDNQIDEKIESKRSDVVVPTTTATSTASASFTPTKKSISIFHLAVMPCHDKKLEASRSDFIQRITGSGRENIDPINNSSSYDDSILVCDIDMVLTTTECLQLIQEALVRQKQQQDTSSSSIATATDGHDSQSDAYRQPDNPSQSACTMDDIRNHLLSLPPAMVKSIHDDDLLCKGFSSSWIIATESTSRGVLITTPSEVALPASTGSSHDEDQGNQTSTTDEELLPFVWGSGGYAQMIFVRAAQQLFNIQLSRDQIQWKTVDQHRRQQKLLISRWNEQPLQSQPQPRSARVARQQQKLQRRDFYEAVLYRCSNPPDQQNPMNTIQPSYYHYTTELPPPEEKRWTIIEPVLRFAIAYGMQTIQRVLDPLGKNDKDRTVVTKINSITCDDNDSYPYHYVEVMACPSGCLNGGGQGRYNRRIDSHLDDTKTISMDPLLVEVVKPPPTTITISAQTSLISFHRETPSETRKRLREIRQLLQRPLHDDGNITNNNNNHDGDSNNNHKDDSSSSLPPHKVTHHQHHNNQPTNTMIPSNMKFPQHTQYHIVPPLEYSKGVALSGVSVQDIQW